MKCRRVIGEGHGYWNIKGCGDAARFFASNCLLCIETACGDFCRKCGTNVAHSEIRAKHGKT